MPVLSITERGKLTPLSSSAVLAVMVWPNPEDEDKREKLIQKVLNGEDYRRPAIASRTLSFTMAGLIVVRIRTLAAIDPERANVDQVIADLVALRKAGGGPKRSGISRRNLWRMWKANRRIAHLAASYVRWIENRREAVDASSLDPFNIETVPSFLLCSEDYRRWAETFVPPHALKYRHGRARPLLDGKLTWKLPNDLVLPEGSQTATTVR